MKKFFDDFLNENKIYKFKKGDYVSYSDYSYNDREKVYVIVERQKKYKPNGECDYVYYSIESIDDESRPINWVHEWELRLSPDYKIAALKYNL